MCDTVSQLMWLNRDAGVQARAGGWLMQEVLLSALSLVSEIMLEDVPLAEQVRDAVMGLWHAGQEGHPTCKLHAVRSCEEQVLPLLCLAMRQGYTEPGSTERLLTLLGRLEAQECARAHRHRPPRGRASGASPAAPRRNTKSPATPAAPKLTAPRHQPHRS